ncbi:MAG: cobalt-precorrin-5B (C(1))-methyltransferase CbiD [Acetivibrionales bacterium]|jgi:cobalt-precorrin-5B (C1)-methyltransferase
MNDYVIINGRKFRKGYTTGTCAAAASKASVTMLLSQKAVNSICVDTPAGIRLTLPVADARVSDGFAVCSVVKDGGDDPDVTTGLKVFAKARLTHGRGVRIKPGEGIGRVTLPGLKVKVGEPAINPVPVRMILKEVNEVLPDNRGIEIVLSVPGGDEIAKKTYNPKLGIEGGISILGTTGVVHPMSEEAWKESLALELSIMAARGIDAGVYTFGNYGEDFVSCRLGISGDYIVKISNFVGYMLEKGVENGLSSILLAGHPGKLVKVAGGIFHTHSKVADARMEILSSYAALEGASRDITERIYRCRTTEAAVEIIENEGLTGVYSRIVNNVSQKCGQYIYNKARVGTVLFNAANELLGMDKNAQKMIEELGGSYG